MFGLKAAYSTPRVKFFHGKSATAKQEFMAAHPGAQVSRTNGGSLYTAPTGEELTEVDRAAQHFILRVPVKKSTGYKGTRLESIWRT